MTANYKIATCCYCGTRAALQLRGDVQHELACASCGAPLHNLKMLKADVAADNSAPRHKVDPRQRPHSSGKKAMYQKPAKKRKKRKGLTARLFEEAFDAIEDLLD
ncbi:hypothetical protein [Primorskyibacter sedentarius]|uniref:hypothetical protein n=1 Tax=Primorskyibacter sedentarius TaxID=745311 RepID=UPI003EB70B22